MRHVDHTLRLCNRVTVINDHYQYLPNWEYGVDNRKWWGNYILYDCGIIENCFSDLLDKDVTRHWVGAPIRWVESLSSHS